MDYEEMILSRQEYIYDGSIMGDEIEIRELNIATGIYETKTVLRGVAAKRYMEENDIW